MATIYFLKLGHMLFSLFKATGLVIKTRLIIKTIVSLFFTRTRILFYAPYNKKPRLLHLGANLSPKGDRHCAQWGQAPCKKGIGACPQPLRCLSPNDHFFIRFSLGLSPMDKT